jgi:hypothetical protein
MQRTSFHNATTRSHLSTAHRRAGSFATGRIAGWALLSLARQEAKIACNFSANGFDTTPENQ